MEAILIYALVVYWLYHVVGQSDILAMPRDWFIRAVGSTVSYPLTCAFCFTSHVSWMLLVATWMLPIEVVGVSWQAMVFVAPVINLVLDLAVRKMRQDAEPPVLHRSPFDPESQVSGRPVTYRPFPESWTPEQQSGWKS